MLAIPVVFVVLKSKPVVVELDHFRSSCSGVYCYIKT